MNLQKIRVLLTYARNGLSYLLRGDFQGFARRWHSIKRERRMSGRITSLPQSILPGTLLKWCVMATPHTLFIGKLIARRLREHGWNVTLLTEAPEVFDHHFYVVVCPQMFRRLPPPERRFAYQMEQSVSSRWFTKDYLDSLRDSRGVLEYALVNFEFLEKHEVFYPHTYYLPVGADPSYGDDLEREEKIYDVLFYGDANSSPRRQKLLVALEQRFSVHRCSEVFGDEMRREIKRAKLVINLHYYENALLEMPRIQECISLGVPVVSEASQDQGDYPEIQSAVRFFAQGDEAAMLAAVASALNDPIPEETVVASAEAGWRRFCFMFDRFLTGTQLLHPRHLLDDALPIPGDAERIALSLPETIQRRRSYDRHSVQGSVTFDGLRYSPGWIGCGLSYAALAKHGLRHSIDQLMVLEDDAWLPEDFLEKEAIIRAYLRERDGEWDVFAGVIADLHPDVQILKVEAYKGLRFVTLDKMTSMVCNIYSKNAQSYLAEWNPAEGDAYTNTIDRYLEQHAKLRVVVLLPFLANLREELNSTLWGIDNRRYIEMITETEQKLVEKTEAFLAMRRIEQTSLHS